MLGFALLSVDCGFYINRAKFMGEKYDLESSQVKRVAKHAQHAQCRKIQGTFRMLNEDQNASFKKHQDRLGQSPPQAARGVHHRLPVGPTTARDGWGTVVRGTVDGRAPRSAAKLSVFFVPFRFPIVFSAFSGHYVFKMGIYLALEGDRIHRIVPQTFSKTPLKKKEEEEEGGSKGDVFGTNRKIGIQNQHKLSFLFFLS